MTTTKGSCVEFSLGMLRVLVTKVGNELHAHTNDDRHFPVNKYAGQLPAGSDVVYILMDCLDLRRVDALQMAAEIAKL